MGPVIILDKSAFQSFSRREHLSLHIHFLENPTPILAMELLADLKKPSKDGKSPQQKVQELAEKFGGKWAAIERGLSHHLCECFAREQRAARRSHDAPERSSIAGTKRPFGYRRRSFRV